MINYILKIDYTLSCWFSKTKDKIIPGTSFLFLNKLVFILVFFLLIVYKLFLNEFEIKIFVGGLIILVLLLMYGFQKPMERHINKGQFKKEYLKLEKSVVRKRRLIGIGLFLVSFLMIFLAVFI